MEAAETLYEIAESSVTAAAHLHSKDQDRCQILFWRSSVASEQPTDWAV
jgi:hypothetical protein